MHDYVDCAIHDYVDCAIPCMHDDVGCVLPLQKAIEDHVRAKKQKGTLIDRVT
jgi:hypothetical protein